MRAGWLPLLLLLGLAASFAQAQFGGLFGGLFGGRPSFDSRGVASNGFGGECSTFKACFLLGRSLCVSCAR